MEARQELYENIIMYLMSEDIQVEKIKEGMYAVLSDYEIQKRCTDVALVQTDRNAYLIKRFLVAKTVKGCTSRTIEYYKTNLQRIIERLGKTVDDITADDIRLYIALRIKRDKISKVTADNELRTLRTFFTYLQSEEIVSKNPMHNIERIKAWRMKKEALTEMEVEMLRHEASNDSRKLAVVEVLLSTGIRLSELVGIMLEEIEGERILVHGKGEKDRYVYLNARAKLTIDRYLKERTDDNPYLFPGGRNATDISGDGKSKMRTWWKYPELVTEDTHIEKGTIEQMMRKLAKRAGVEQANPHKFRRTCATMALRRGMPIEQVSKMLGHESIQTTQIYLDLNEEDLIQAHRKYVV